MKLWLLVAAVCQTTCSGLAPVAQFPTQEECAVAALSAVQNNPDKMVVKALCIHALAGVSR